MSQTAAQIAVAVEVAVGDGFHDVVVLDGGGGFEVGGGAGHLEDAVVGSGAHVHALHGITIYSCSSFD